MRRWCSAAVVAAVAAVALAGCSAPASDPIPAASALVGTWRSTGGGSLTLDADRTCRADLISVGIDVVSGHCTWRVDGRDAAHAPTVVLDFHADAAAHFDTAVFEVQGTGRTATLRHDDGSGQDTFYVLQR